MFTTKTTLMLWCSQRNVSATNNGIALAKSMKTSMKVMYSISLEDSNGTTTGITTIMTTSFPINIANGLMISILS